MESTLAGDLVIANRTLARFRIVDVFGHVSVRQSTDRDRYLLSRSRAPALVTPEDIIEYDLASSAVCAAGRKQYLERFIHGEIYKMRPDVNAVVHNHSPSLVQFSVSTVKLRPLYHMAGFFDDLPIFDIAERFGPTDLLVRDAECGRALAQTLGTAPAVLMRGHGVTIVGPSLSVAVGRSIYLEENARILTSLKSLGGDIRYLHPDETSKIVALGEHQAYERAWELWREQSLEEPRMRVRDLRAPE